MERRRRRSKGSFLEQLLRGEGRREGGKRGRRRRRVGEWLRSK